MASSDLFYEVVNVNMGSEWKYFESRKIIDQDLSTSWKGDRLKWHYDKTDSVILTFPGRLEVGVVRFWYDSANSVPVAYTYSCSDDLKTWNHLNFVPLMPFVETKDKGYVLNKLEGKACRYLKMDII